METEMIDKILKLKFNVLIFISVVGLLIITIHSVIFLKSLEKIFIQGSLLGIGAIMCISSLYVLYLKMKYIYTKNLLKKILIITLAIIPLCFAVFWSLCHCIRITVETHSP